MNRGFYTIMAAQFCSSLADNALLICAIALLRDINAPEWMTPMLKLFFFVSYVVLAAFVGAFADSMPKGRVMMITNTIKIGGCLLMFAGAHPLVAYAVVGLGAAAYSPAKYGILTELLPPEKLVIANGWIEGLTVGSIILGFVVGGVLVSPNVAAYLMSIDVPLINYELDSPAEAAIAVVAVFYAVAAAVNFFIPDTGARYAKQATHPMRLLSDFAHCVRTLWRDKLGQISLSVTTLFWGAGATLQFIVLKWSETTLGMSLSQGAILQAVVAIGIAIGSVWAAARVSLKRSLDRAAGRRGHGSARRQPRHPGLLVLAGGGNHDRRIDARLGRRRRRAGDGRDRRACRLLRRADERAAAASRACAAVGGPLDRGAELQREPEHPGDAVDLCATALARPAHRDDHRAVRLSLLRRPCCW
jgi:MFS family permease